MMKNMMKSKNENWEKELKRPEVEVKRDSVNPEFLNSKTSQEDSEYTSKTLNNTTDFCIKEMK